MHRLYLPLPTGIFFVLLVGYYTSACAQSADNPKRLADVQIPGVELQVNGQTVLLKLAPDFEGTTIELPRLAAPVRSLGWAGETNSNIKLQPDLTTWKLTWDKPPKNAATIELQLDTPPLLIAECKPIQATGDGSLFLPAHMATTSGDKIRYEPQPYKNTVGYWAGMQNTASWSVSIAKPGKFNVAILQGCGSGNGGSTAELTLQSAAGGDSTSAKATARVEFEVEETGHFQNFVWRHLGEINVAEPGDYQLLIKPKSIKRGALMDVRAVHLVRLP